MTSRTAFLLFATIAHLVSAQSEIHQDAVDNAPRGGENCRAPSDAATLIQSPVGITTAAFAAADMKGQEEEDAEDDADDEVKELEDVGYCPEYEVKMHPDKCGPVCHADASCFGYYRRRFWFDRRRKLNGPRRRKNREGKCNFYRGSNCPARCKKPDNNVNMMDNLGNEYKDNLYDGDTYILGCSALGYSLSFDAPETLNCTKGTLSGPTNFSCLRNIVKGTLSVKGIHATNLKDSDWGPGQSDPYVVLKYDDKTETTNFKEDTANAMWSRTLEFKDPDRSKMLRVNVWDRDGYSGLLDDDLGGGYINLKEVIETKREKTYTFNLTDQGQLSINVSFQVAER